MADATESLVGRSVGHEWAVFVATSGHFCWPPTGSSDWPLTVFRIPPEGDGFMTTTWPSLLRIFVTCLVAVTISVIAAASGRTTTASHAGTS